MADGGVTEAALLAAAADTAAAGGTAAAGTAAAATAADLAATAGTAAAAGTAADLGATAAGTVAAGTAADLGATAAGTAAADAPLTIAATAPYAADAPLTFATSSEPLLGASVAPDAATTAASAPSTSLLGGAVDTPVADAGSTGLHSAAWTQGTGQFAPTTQPISPGLLDKAVNWWDTTSTGTKLQAGQKLLSGVSTAAGAAKAATPAAQAGPKTTFTQGAVGKPQGGEQQLAAIVNALLQKRDAYLQGQLGGAPIVYRPRSLLG